MNTDSETEKSSLVAANEPVDDAIQGPAIPEEWIASKRADLLAKEYEQQRLERKEFADDMMRLACKKTGLSEQQIRAMWLGLEPPRAVIDPKSIASVRAKSLMQVANVPALHMDNMLAPNTTEVLEYIKEYMRSGMSILVLSGGKGIGKTAAACWALSQREGFFMKAAKLLTVAFQEPATLRLLTRSGLVVLDDLGAEIHDEKGHWLRVFNDLFDDWYSAKTRVIITTNLDADRFKASYGERVVDRIREAGRFKVIAGESMRGVQP